MAWFLGCLMVDRLPRLAVGITAGSQAYFIVRLYNLIFRSPLARKTVKSFPEVTELVEL
jgi:hypothetical protein